MEFTRFGLRQDPSTKLWHKDVPLPPLGYKWLVSRQYKDFGSVRVEGHKLVRRRRFPIHHNIVDMSDDEEQLCDYLVKVMSYTGPRTSQQWREYKESHRRTVRTMGPKKSNRIAKREREAAGLCARSPTHPGTPVTNNPIAGATEINDDAPHTLETIAGENSEPTSAEPKRQRWDKFDPEQCN